MINTVTMLLILDSLFETPLAYQVNGSRIFLPKSQVKVLAVLREEESAVHGRSVSAAMADTRGWGRHSYYATDLKNGGFAMHTCRWSVIEMPEWLAKKHGWTETFFNPAPEMLVKAMSVHCLVELDVNDVQEALSARDGRLVLERQKMAS